MEDFYLAGASAGADGLQLGDKLDRFGESPVTGKPLEEGICGARLSYNDDVDPAPVERRSIKEGSLAVLQGQSLPQWRGPSSLRLVIQSSNRNEGSGNWVLTAPRDEGGD